MSGKNISIFSIPPGVQRNMSQYAAGQAWWNANLVRWFNSMLVPIGGWVKQTTTINNAQVALQPYTSGIAFSFLDGSMCFKDNGTLLYSGPIAAPAVVTGNVTHGPQGSYVDVANYVTLDIGLTGVTQDYTAACTMMAEWSIPALVTTGAQTAASFGASADLTNNRFYLQAYNIATLLPRSVLVANGANTMVQSNVPWTTPALDTVYRIASAYDATSGNTAWNALLLTADPTITIPSVPTNTLRMGNLIQSSGQSAGLQGYLREVVLLPQRVADADLQTWTSTTSSYSEPIRDTHSWRDFLKVPWGAYGSANRLWAAQINLQTAEQTLIDITPAALGYNPGGIAGYGSGPYGSGLYGISDSGTVTQDQSAQWSLDNFGKLLVGVHSQDGRLVSWDPVTPATIAQPVLTAPIDNTLVLVSDEEFLILMGGKNNPRRIKWASQRTIDDWVPTQTNSAGGFDLQSNGSIVSAIKVNGGILVLTDTDAHLLEYIGPPYYYGRKSLTDACSIVSKNAIVSTPRGALWMGPSNFWMYDGTIHRFDCSVAVEPFYRSDLTYPQLVFGGINDWSQEAWFFYPSIGSAEPNRYVAFSYSSSGSDYWTLGEMTRTAWLNSCWQPKPLGVYDQTIYQQETGTTADGLPMTVFAETGAFEISQGDTSMRVDRIYPDISNLDTGEASPDALSATFDIRQAPDAPIRIYGPVALSSPNGYKTVRMRARQISMRIDQTNDIHWALGNMRLRIKPAGVR